MGDGGTWLSGLTLHAPYTITTNILGVQYLPQLLKASCQRNLGH